MSTASDPHQLSIERYRARAAGYDDSAAYTMPLRRRTIELLALKRGDVVLDVGAGTGLSFELLQAAVGREGRVLAFEQSPDMFRIAEGRVKAAAWPNVWQVRGAAHEVQLPEAPDAVLFNYVHDISRMPHAVHHVLSQAKPGARIAVAGMKFFPWWTGPLNILAWLKNRPYNALAADLWHPWDLIEAGCDDFQRWTTQAGMGYIARGRRKVTLPEQRRS